MFCLAHELMSTVAADPQRLMYFQPKVMRKNAVRLFQMQYLGIPNLTAMPFEASMLAVLPNAL